MNCCQKNICNFLYWYWFGSVVKWVFFLLLLHHVFLNGSQSLSWNYTRPHESMTRCHFWPLSVTTLMSAGLWGKLLFSLNTMKCASVQFSNFAKVTILNVICYFHSLYIAWHITAITFLNLFRGIPGFHLQPLDWITWLNYYITQFNVSNSVIEL